MTTTTTNGQVRKTLASQLDRLDSILDGLSDALNGAVATAVEGAVERAVRHAVSEAVKETLQAVIAEMIANPDLLTAARALLNPGTPAEVSSDPPDRPVKPHGVCVTPWGVSPCSSRGGVGPPARLSSSGERKGCGQMACEGRVPRDRLRAARPPRRGGRGDATGPGRPGLASRVA